MYGKPTARKDDMNDFVLPVKINVISIYKFRTWISFSLIRFDFYMQMLSKFDKVYCYEFYDLIRIVIGSINSLIVLC